MNQEMEFKNIVAQYSKVARERSAEDHNSWRSLKSAGRTSVIFFEAKLIKMSGSRIFCT